MFNLEVQEKILNYFQSRWGLKEAPKDWYRGDCPYCGGRNTFGINITNGATNCFKNKCSDNKRVFSVILELESLSSYSEVHKLIGTYNSALYSKLAPTRLIKNRKVEELKLPDDYKMIDEGNSITANLIRNYLTKKRGLKIKELTLKGIGYCTEGKLKGYVIIPYYFSGKLIYYTSRAVLATGPKFNNPDASNLEIGKSDVIYNQDALHTYSHVRIVESAFNALTYGNYAIALGGKYASDWQLLALIKAPVETYTIALDPDAMLEAYRLGLLLAFHKKVRILKLPKGRDVNDLGRKAIRKLEKKHKILTYNQILKLYKDAQSAQYSYNL